MGNKIHHEAQTAQGGSRHPEPTRSFIGDLRDGTNDEARFQRALQPVSRIQKASLKQATMAVHAKEASWPVKCVPRLDLARS
jgi:hypothetical protein